MRLNELTALLKQARVIAEETRTQIVKEAAEASETAPPGNSAPFYLWRESFVADALVFKLKAAELELQELQAYMDVPRGPRK